MLLRLIEYQDWKKIGMADMLLDVYSIPKIVRSDIGYANGKSTFDQN